LEQRAHDGFKAWVDEALAEGVTDLPKNWSYRELTAEFRSMCLWFRPPLLAHAYLDTTLTIKREGVPVGRYRLITNLEGEDEDDYFVIDADPANPREGAD
jgi:hypothetical protein